MMFLKGDKMWEITHLSFLVLCLSINNFGSGLAVTQGSQNRQFLTKLGETYNTPEQIHLTFGSHPNDIVVMWSSSSDKKSSVEYSSSSQAIKKVDAQSVELKEHSKEAKKFIYRAKLENLTPGARYSYRIMSGLSGVKSNLFSFNVPQNDRKKPHTFLVLADLGLQTKSLQFIIHEAINNKYEAVMHIGDLAYNLDGGGGSIGDRFMNKIEKFTSVVPYVTTPGDHERFFNYYHYRHRFSTPGAQWPMQENELWYSIDIGYVHFISISTDGLLVNNGNKQKQIAWLKDDLIKANQNRQQFPWIIVMGHKPVYCTKSVMEQECDREFSGLRDSLEDLFFEYGVDVMISGHKHCYERTWPMYNGKVFQKSYVDPTAPIYIVTGALGYEYLLDGQLSKPQWLAFGLSKRGKELYGRLKILNGSHLIWSQHAASNNEEVDNIQVVQPRHGSFGAPGKIAMDKWKERMSGRVQQLPPEPFKIIEVPAKNPVLYFGFSRKVILCVGVFALAFFLVLFLRHSKVRKVLRV